MSSLASILATQSLSRPPLVPTHPEEEIKSNVDKSAALSNQVGALGRTSLSGKTSDHYYLKDFVQEITGTYGTDKDSAYSKEELLFLTSLKAYYTEFFQKREICQLYRETNRNGAQETLCSFSGEPLSSRGSFHAIEIPLVSFVWRICIHKNHKKIATTLDELFLPMIKEVGFYKNLEGGITIKGQKHRIQEISYRSSGHSKISINFQLINYSLRVEETKVLSFEEMQSQAIWDHEAVAKQLPDTLGGNFIKGRIYQAYAKHDLAAACFAKIEAYAKVRL